MPLWEYLTWAWYSSVCMCFCGYFIVFNLFKKKMSLSIQCLIASVRSVFFSTHSLASAVISIFFYGTLAIE